MDRAKELEDRYDWTGAADVYAESIAAASGAPPGDIGGLLERRAYALHKAALTSDSPERFKALTQQAIDCYGQAGERYTSSTVPGDSGRCCRCEAMVSYLQQWLETDVTRKKELLEQAWTNGKSALSQFEQQGWHTEFANTFNRISYVGALLYCLSDTSTSREKRLRDCLSCGEKSLRLLEGTGEKVELARTHAKICSMCVTISKDFTEYREKDKVELDAWNHWLKAMELSEDDALLEIPFLMHLEMFPAACSTEQRMSFYLKAKELASRTGDRFLLGCIMDGLTQRLFAKAVSTEDADERESLQEEALKSAKAAQALLSCVMVVSPNASSVWTRLPEAGYYGNRLFFEKDPQKRKVLAKREYVPAVEQMDLADKSGYPDVQSFAHSLLGDSLMELAKHESDVDKRREYLEKATEHLKKTLENDLRIHPYHYFLLGDGMATVSQAQYETAQAMSSADKKMETLREAVRARRESAALSERDLAATQDSNPDAGGIIARSHFTAAGWLEELHNFSGQDDDLRHASESFLKASEWFARSGLSGNCAESAWKAARDLDRLGEHEKASEAFGRAAEEYKTASDRIPRLKEFYLDYSFYMRAWRAIEQAKYYHRGQEPDLSGRCYLKAASIHGSTKRWKYLSTNYSAWAKIEQAEALSRREEYQEACAAFEEAVKLFDESQRAIHERITHIEDNDEKLMARNLEKATDTRRGYCNARISLEQARLLEKRGELQAASAKYASSIDLFERLKARVESENDRKECDLIITLTRAWEVVTRAEAEDSPELYSHASKLFEEAKNISPGEKGKLMALGHSRFCRALEMGARFSDTGDLALHVLANQDLDSAANYYTKAGLQAAAEYAMASKLLFEGYVHLSKANGEHDQTQKAKLYTIAEKLLEASLSGLSKADQPGKIESVKHLLSRVRGQKDLAVSLTEVLRAPEITSSTVAFSTPTPSYENATGTEGLGGPNLQACCAASSNEMKIGEELEIQIEMVNAGNTSASVSRVDNFVPVGFEVIKKPDRCRVEGSSLVVKGHRIDPLESDDLTFIVKPTTKGSFEIRPQIVFADDTGKSLSRAAEGVKLTVRELGIAGWLRGPQGRT